MNTDLTIILKNKLDSQLQNDIDNLLRICCDFEPICVSFPFDEESCIYILGYKNNILICMIPLIYISEGLYECSAWTHPDFRRMGFFKMLWSFALKKLPDNSSVQFINDANSILGRFAAKKINAVKIYTQHLMSLDLTAIPEYMPDYFFKVLPVSVVQTNKTVKTHKADPLNTDEKSSHSDLTDTDNSNRYIIKSDKRERKLNLFQGTVVAEFNIINYKSKKDIYFYGFFINKKLRGKGFGYYIFNYILNFLKKSGHRMIYLQVEDSNVPAFRIYRKSGFYVIEAVEYYEFVLRKQNH